MVIFISHENVVLSSYSDIILERLAKLYCDGEIPKGVCWGPIFNNKDVNHQHVGVLIYPCGRPSEGWVLHGTPCMSKWGPATSLTGELYCASMDEWLNIEKAWAPNPFKVDIDPNPHHHVKQYFETNNYLLLIQTH